MTREQQKAYVKNWAETGRWLEEVRWQELARLDPDSALRASLDLLDMGFRAWRSPDRYTWSSLIDLQDRLHRRTP